APMLAQLTRKTMALGSKCPGYLPLARCLRARSAAVIMYHGVTAEPLPVPNWCQLDAAAFAQRIEFLASHYTVLPLLEVVNRLDRKQPLPRRSAVITFDDGFRNVLTPALPVLQRYQLPATVFLVTGLIGTRQPAWPDCLFFAVMQSIQASIKFDGRT